MLRQTDDVVNFWQPVYVVTIVRNIVFTLKYD